MQSESIVPPTGNGQPAINQETAKDQLADFSTNRRVLLLSAMAIAIGAISSLVAYVLIWLIATITNLAFYHRFSAASAIPEGHHLGLWVVLVTRRLRTSRSTIVSRPRQRFPKATIWDSGWYWCR